MITPRYCIRLTMSLNRSARTIHLQRRNPAFSSLPPNCTLTQRWCCRRIIRGGSASQRQTRTKCGGTFQPCQTVEFQIQNSCIQMQNCTCIRRPARMGPYLRHAHLSCFKRQLNLRLRRAHSAAPSPRLDWLAPLAQALLLIVMWNSQLQSRHLISPGWTIRSQVAIPKLF